MQFKKATVIMEGQGSFNEMAQGIETWETLDSQNLILLLFKFCMVDAKYFNGCK